MWAWFALGFNHVDDSLSLIVAIVWWLAVAADGPFGAYGSEA
ncbi:hypothetical protein [Adlercreutzia equolifaciens]|nr:hypothetical protein [Adlercreutzia equolifaciens]